MSSSFANDTARDVVFEVETALQLCEAIGTARALTVSLLLRNEEWEQYIELGIRPSDYLDPQHFADDYLVTELLRKSPNIPLMVDRRAAALDSFYESEDQCVTTSLRMFLSETPDWTYRFTRELQSILGSLDRRALDSISDSFGFGPGATTGVRGVGSVASDKYDEEIHLTANLVPFYRSILGETWWEHQARPSTIVKGNKFTTVPKTAKTDRGICIEPTLNIYVQKGIGSYIRNRLRLFGIDLNTQERNQELARIAYTNGLCTVDLSSASDSISCGMVAKFFPDDWCHLLDLGRSPSTFIPESGWWDLEKLSSMGNGYTFELESLIFYALLRVFIPNDELASYCSVYGDDLIFPQKYATSIVEALNYLGFRVNGSKSFLSGDFFESCGTDWFRGLNVRPFYLKGSTGSIPYALQTANALRLYAKKRGLDWGCDARFRPLWLNLTRQVPQPWRKCRVPELFGDTGLIVSLREARGVSRAKDGIEGYAILHVVIKPQEKRKRTVGLLLSILARTGSTEIASYGREPVRGYLGRIRTRRSIGKWSDGLEWLT